MIPSIFHEAVEDMVGMKAVLKGDLSLPVRQVGRRRGVCLNKTHRKLLYTTLISPDSMALNGIMSN